MTGKDISVHAVRHYTNSREIKDVIIQDSLNTVNQDSRYAMYTTYTLRSGFPSQDKCVAIDNG